MPLALTLDPDGEQLVTGQLRTGRYQSPEEESTPEALLERLRVGGHAVVPAHWPRAAAESISNGSPGLLP